MHGVGLWNRFKAYGGCFCFSLLEFDCGSTAAAEAAIVL